jgi:hypothetical protein
MIDFMVANASDKMITNKLKGAKAPVKTTAGGGKTR